jgi:hypothetical protein
MASELFGLGLSAAILLAASVSTGFNDQHSEEGAPSPQIAREMFDTELMKALQKDEGSVLCLAGPFKLTPFEKFRHELAQIDISSNMSESVPNALDIDLSPFLSTTVSAVEGERKLFQALAKENVLLCPSEALALPLSQAGHFFVTSPITDSQVPVVIRRIARAVQKKGDFSEPAISSTNNKDSKIEVKDEEDENTGSTSQQTKKRRIESSEEKDSA